MGCCRSILDQDEHEKQSSIRHKSRKENINTDNTNNKSKMDEINNKKTTSKSKNDKLNKENDDQEQGLCICCEEVCPEHTVFTRFNITGIYKLTYPEKYVILTLFNKDCREGVDIFPVVETTENFEQYERLLKLDQYAKNQTMVFINGFTCAGQETDVIRGMKQYIEVGNGKNNIINVDWARLARGWYGYYINARYATSVGKFLCDWFTKNGFNGKNLHLVGYSMGAHLAGACGRFMSEKERNTQVKRITALDPARPGYEYNPWVKGAIKLSPKCAEFVDIIHTNAGTFGHLRPLGHVDFYVNGGTKQPTNYKNWLAYHSYSVKIFFATIPYDKRDLFPSYECKFSVIRRKGNYAYDPKKKDKKGNNLPPTNYLGMLAHPPERNVRSVYLTETDFNPEEKPEEITEKSKLFGFRKKTKKTERKRKLYRPKKNKV